MSEVKIRDIINEKIIKLRETDSISPSELAKESIELSSLYSSVNKELIGRKMDYNKKREQLLIEHGTASKAKIHAEATPEYQALIEAEAYSESVLEMIRATKRAVALAERELIESQY